MVFEMQKGKGMIHGNKPFITIARHLRSPIDSYHFNQLYSKKYHCNIIEVPCDPLVSLIRDCVILETHYDPLDNPKCHRKEPVKARQLFLYFVMKHTDYTQAQAGWLVRKDRTTVIAAMKNVDKYYDIEPDYRDLYNRINERIIRNHSVI
jgi:hypothetical protein